MRIHEEHTAGLDPDRFARLQALYERYCQGSTLRQDDQVDVQMIEVPCELAPGVRRRFVRPTLQ